MSIISFITKIWDGVKKLFSKFPAELKQAVKIGVTVVANIQKLVDSPVADVLTAIIPGTADDMIKAKLRQALPVFLKALKLADVTMDLRDPEAIMQTALQSIRELDPEIKPAFYHSLSILVAQVAADGELSWSDGVMVLEWYYKNQYKPAV